MKHSVGGTVAWGWNPKGGLWFWLREGLGAAKSGWCFWRLKLWGNLNFPRIYGLRRGNGAKERQQNSGIARGDRLMWGSLWVASRKKTRQDTSWVRVWVFSEMGDGCGVTLKKKKMLPSRLQRTREKTGGAWEQNELWKTSNAFNLCWADN